MTANKQARSEGMNEPDSTETAYSRWITRISVTLAVIAALVVLVFVGCLVTVYVVTRNYESLLDAVEKGDTFAVRCFLLRGADVDAEDENGRTPLHLAACGGHTEVAELLIARGANVNVKDKQGKTPLGLAVERNRKDVAEQLIA